MLVCIIQVSAQVARGEASSDPTLPSSFPLICPPYVLLIVLVTPGGCCSVDKSCPTLCSSMDRSTPGFLVLHCLPEFAQIHVH